LHLSRCLQNFRSSRRQAGIRGCFRIARWQLFSGILQPVLRRAPLLFTILHDLVKTEAVNVGLDLYPSRVKFPISSCAVGLRSTGHHAADWQVVGAGFDGGGFVAGKEFLVKQGHAMRGGVTCFLKVES